MLRIFGCFVIFPVSNRLKINFPPCIAYPFAFPKYYIY